ncbi:MAG: GntR family transcriptional regulator [Firmicutes bacterium]|nr:GntR family transcriptional regulator [Bacillota bacterium]
MLQSAIATGELLPGRKLVIDALARQLQVSITPVREALMRLQREGLVTEVPYSGMHVSKLSTTELRELFSLRGLLEGYAVRLAADGLTASDLEAIRTDLELMEEASEQGDQPRFREINMRFHTAILSAAGGTALQELIGQLTRNTERYRNVADHTFDRDYLKAAQVEHRLLFSLLEQRRGEEAELLARKHALTFVAYMSRHLEAWR